MKISIITIYNINNFGSCMQAYALQKALERKGHETEVIAYNPKYLTLVNLRTVIGRLVYFYNFIPTHLKYRKFIKQNIKLTGKNYSNYKQLEINPPAADLYIAGGDQLWNSYFKCGRDKAFKLKFADGRKLAFGTSLGRDNYSEKELLELKVEIKEFEVCCLRESSSVELLKKVNRENVYQVLDPVALLPLEDYKELMVLPKIENYVFVYLVEKSEELNTLLRFLRDHLSVKIVLCAGYTPKCSYDVWIKTVAPQEALGFIYNARFVISASFHATMFSILFQKNFVSLLPNEDTQARIKDLLGMFELTERMIQKKEDITQSILEDIAYEKLSKKLMEKIGEANRILDNIIEEKTEVLACIPDI